jgi:hypothetical protein
MIENCSCEFSWSLYLGHYILIIRQSAVFTMTVRIANYQAISYNHDSDNIAGGDAVSSSNPSVVVKPYHQSNGNGNRNAGHVDSTNNSTPKPSVVFESPAKYHPCTFFLLALAPASTLLGLALVPVYFDETVSDEDRRSITKGMLWATTVIIIVYSLVLPKRFEVLSDASIRLVTWIPSLAHTFPNATAAYDNPPLHQNLFRPRLKFATDLNSRVVVRRRNEGWDLLVSLHDAPGFVAAVWKVAGEVESRIGIV